MAHTPKQYRITVFGKEGCSKCKVLQSRIKKLLNDPGFEIFDYAYASLDTEEGLIQFCKAESINPQRVPAFVVERRDDLTEAYIPIAPKNPPNPNDSDVATRLFTVLGLQTDYSDEGGGVLYPEQIKQVLQEATA
jgi:hypothetical protein